LALDSAEETMDDGELGCKTRSPAISEATAPRAVLEGKSKTQYRYGVRTMKWNPRGTLSAAPDIPKDALENVV
jgi:hypothetical protein